MDVNELISFLETFYEEPSRHAVVRLRDEVPNIISLLKELESSKRSKDKVSRKQGNTPSPCDKCRYLYADCLQKNNPLYQAVCTVTGGKWGDPNCPRFEKRL